MSEESTRDKHALRLAKLQGSVEKSAKGASIHQLKLWAEQLNDIWISFNNSHEKLMKRAGVDEKGDYETTFNNNLAIREEIQNSLDKLIAKLDAAPHAAPTQGEVQQSSDRRAIRRVANYIDANREELVQYEIIAQRQELERLHVQLQTVRLQRIVNGENEAEVIQDEDELSALYMRSMHILATLIPVHNAPAPAQAAPCDANAIKIPSIQISPFDGRLETWEAFRDNFDQSIHQRANMPAVQKLQYLKSLVKGEAEELVRNFVLNSENYASAWQLLNSRYNNVRDLVWSHMRAITSQRVCRESADEIRRLMNRTASAILALANLGRPTIGAADDWIVFHIVEKLDQESRKMWEQRIAVNEAMPTWNQLEEFLNGRVRSLSAIGSIKSSGNPSARGGRSTHSNQVNTRGSNSQGNSNSDSRSTCPCCDGKHLIQFCENFRRLSIDARRGLMAAKQLCFVCMAAGHQATSCKVTRSCQTCNRRHNTMLHVETEEQTQQANSVLSCSADATAAAGTKVILATALIYVQDSDGGLHQLRALLDQGSQSSFLSEDAAQMLRLPRRKTAIDVVGIGGIPAGKLNQSVLITIHSRFNKAQVVRTNALIIRRLSNMTNVVVAHHNQWPHIHGLSLADPDFMRPQKIDMLIGGDIYGSLLLPGLRKLVGGPTAQNTSLGWILSGRVSSSELNNKLPRIMSFNCNVIDELSRFWEIEETQMARALTSDEESCEKHYLNTVTRDESGRLHVRLPIRNTNAVFGDSQSVAIQRQVQLEKRLSSNREFANDYRKFMLQYEQLGHMSLVKDTQIQAKRDMNDRHYYIPHHAVIKQSSTSTKLRVVFDASRKSTNGFSLNDHLHIGPRLQDDLTAIIMRWRRHQFGFCADIEKMYRQIAVDQPDSDMQRIVWRPNANEPMKVYRLTTVTYGTAAAPYLAIKSLQTLANLERERFPRGSEVALNSFYVDDVLSGADTIENCIDIQKQLIGLLSSGGFTLRKWVSNSEEVLQQVPPDHRERQLPLNIDDGMSIKTLGIQWNPSSDDLSFNIPNPDVSKNATKRSFLSQAARLYDPLGWLAPSTIVVKILFQQLWKANIDWDDALPQEIATQWTTLQKSICCLTSLHIPRWVNINLKSSVEVHGFCDASTAAYAAVVFLRVTTEDGTVKVHNITAKTKVAPLKVISLPRLELCGAALLTKLIADVQSAMQFSDHVSVTCWTDSTIVLAWLRAEPSRFNVYVANRISEIQRSLPDGRWRHVRSEDNPADCASRGLTPQKLTTHHLWWTGPRWLSDPQTMWPNLSDIRDTAEEVRVNVNLAVHAASNFGWDLITKVSSWRRLSRITAWCKRFTANCRLASSERVKGPLTVTELCDARNFWVKDAQSAAYSSDLRRLEETNTLSKSSTLRSLNPLLSISKVLRVGGRLANANTLSSESKFPAIIPRRCPLSALLVSDAHEQTLHGGPSLMLAFLRRRYWLIDGSKEVTQFVKQCMTCFRFKARPNHQQMGALPAARVVPSKPFRHTALDYSGAIMVRTTKGRGHHATKAYICVFVCLSTKAAHIELVGDLTTAAFIAAYERFVARRGQCSDIYSDNATNFVGASTIFLRSERKLFDATVQTTLASRGTTWHFSPPLSPHFNGLAESAIRSIKHHVRRVIGELTLTYEELLTVLVKVEACLNSRPLHPMSADPADFDVLTPGHFLVGEPTVTIPEISVLEKQPSTLTRWKLTQQLVQRIWARWSADYLHTLQQRKKWQLKEPNICVGDLVLVLEDNQPPTKWAVGRITETHPGSDGLIRVVTVRTKNGSYKRAIVKVARLPIEKGDDEDETEA